MCSWAKLVTFIVPLLTQEGKWNLVHHQGSLINAWGSPIYLPQGLKSWLIYFIIMLNFSVSLVKLKLLLARICFNQQKLVRIYSTSAKDTICYMPVSFHIINACKVFSCACLHTLPNQSKTNIHFHSHEGLMLETSVSKLLTVANVYYQLN